MCHESDTAVTLIEKVNSELRNLKKWFDANNPPIDTSNTSHIILHSTQKFIPLNASIKTDKNKIAKVKCVNFSDFFWMRLFVGNIK